MDTITERRSILVTMMMILMAFCSTPWTVQWLVYCNLVLSYLSFFFHNLLPIFPSFLLLFWLVAFCVCWMVAFLDLVRPFLDLVRPYSLYSIFLSPCISNLILLIMDIRFVKCLSSFPPNSRSPSLSIPHELLQLP